MSDFDKLVILASLGMHLIVFLLFWRPAFPRTTLRFRLTRYLALVVIAVAFVLLTGIERSVNTNLSKLHGSVSPLATTTLCSAYATIPLVVLVGALITFRNRHNTAANPPIAGLSTPDDQANHDQPRP